MTFLYKLFVYIFYRLCIKNVQYCTYILFWYCKVQALTAWNSACSLKLKNYYYNITDSVWLLFYQFLNSEIKQVSIQVYWIYWSFFQLIQKHICWLNQSERMNNCYQQVLKRLEAMAADAWRQQKCLVAHVTCWTLKFKCNLIIIGIIGKMGKTNNEKVCCSLGI